jgi:co-chaperonin GroES (HSP10)
MSELDITPLNGNTLLKVQTVKQIGSIYIPDSVEEKGAKRAEVIAVSSPWHEAGETISSALAPGQTVILHGYAGTEISFDNEDYLLCPEKDVIARVGR